MPPTKVCTAKVSSANRLAAANPAFNIRLFRSAIDFRQIRIIILEYQQGKFRMGREAKFAREELLRAAAVEAAMGRPVTIQTLAAASGATVGSIYHRFASREEILSQAWLLAVRGFQSAFVPALDAAARAEDGVAAALVVPRWSRENPELASLLTLRRQEDFLDDRTPANVRREAAA